MEFISAGKILGPDTPMRVLTLKGAPGLPDGQYSLVDCYCADPDCDCRKVMIQVHHDQQYVALINYGWEPIAFYKKWYGAEKIDLQTVDEMKGPSVDISSPNLVDPDAIIDFFRHILDERYRNVLATNYRNFKRSMAKKV